MDVGLKKHYKVSGSVVESQAFASGKGVTNKAPDGSSGSKRSIGYSNVKIPDVDSVGLSSKVGTKD